MEGRLPDPAQAAAASANATAAWRGNLDLRMSMVSLGSGSLSSHVGRAGLQPAGVDANYAFVPEAAAPAARDVGSIAVQGTGRRLSRGEVLRSLAGAGPAASLLMPAPRLAKLAGREWRFARFHPRRSPVRSAVAEVDVQVHLVFHLQRSGTRSSLPGPSRARRVEPMTARETLIWRGPTRAR
jgi:hypothetical protein